MYIYIYFRGSDVVVGRVSSSKYSCQQYCNCVLLHSTILAVDCDTSFIKYVSNKRKNHITISNYWRNGAGGVELPAMCNADVHTVVAYAFLAGNLRIGHGVRKNRCVWSALCCLLSDVPAVWSWLCVSQIGISKTIIGVCFRALRAQLFPAASTITGQNILYSTFYIRPVINAHPSLSKPCFLGPFRFKS